jgi:hypothetical protein
VSSTSRCVPALRTNTSQARLQMPAPTVAVRPIPSPGSCSVSSHAHHSPTKSPAGASGPFRPGEPNADSQDGDSRCGAPSPSQGRRSARHHTRRRSSA